MTDNDQVCCEILCGKVLTGELYTHRVQSTLSVLRLTIKEKYLWSSSVKKKSDKLTSELCVYEEINNVCNIIHYIIQIYSGITSGRVIDGELLYTKKVLEVNLFAFAYRLFHEDFSPIYGAL